MAICEIRGNTLVQLGLLLDRFKAVEHLLIAHNDDQMTPCQIKKKEFEEI